jgi:hypothetical protein
MKINLIESSLFCSRNPNLEMKNETVIFSNLVAELCARYVNKEMKRSVPTLLCITIHTKTKLHGLSPRANYTDRATAACWRSDCQLLRIESATWSA